MIKILRKLKIKEGIWSDNVGEKLEQRMLEIDNNEKELKKITGNKTIIDWAKDFVKDEKALIDKLVRLNYIRIYKKIYLPCKLIGIDGSSEPHEKRNSLERSCIRWKINFAEVRKLSKATIEEWQKYVEWLSYQNVQAIFDFKEYATFKYM